MSICTEVKECDDIVIKELEEQFQIKLKDDIKNFIIKNNGGYPIKDVVTVDDDSYEIRCFLVLDKEDEFDIYRPFKYFYENTKGRIMPFAIDSGDNYYCYNLENGYIYYWSASENMYYMMVESINSFEEMFK